MINDILIVICLKNEKNNNLQKKTDTTKLRWTRPLYPKYYQTAIRRTLTIMKRRSFENMQQRNMPRNLPTSKRKGKKATKKKNTPPKKSATFTHHTYTHIYTHTTQYNGLIKPRLFILTINTLYNKNCAVKKRPWTIQKWASVVKM